MPAKNKDDGAWENVGCPRKLVGVGIFISKQVNRVQTWKKSHVREKQGL